MSVSLRDVTGDNWKEVVRLKVRPDQTSFVASNMYSLAQSVFEPFWVTKAIYHDELVVGFVMYGRDREDEMWTGYWIARLMVDESHQGKGYARAAMEAVLDEIRESGYRGPVSIDFEPANTAAASLYKGLGFVDTGKTLGIGEDAAKIYRLEMG